MGDTRASDAFLKHRFGIGEGERTARRHFDRLPASHELPLERPARIGIKKLQAAMPGEFARVRGLAMTFEIAGRGHGQDRCFDEGSVATILTKDARRWWAGFDRSCGPIEQVGDKCGLAADIMTVNLSNLSLPHHRHGLEARQRVPRRTETAEAEPWPDKALDTPVVLLDDVVQIFTLSQTSAAP